MRFSDKADNFAKTIRVLSRNILGFSRFSLLIEGHSHIILITPSQQHIFDVGKFESLESMQELKDLIAEKISTKTFLQAIFRGEKSPIPDEELFVDSQDALEVRSRVPAISYVMDTHVKQNVDKAFGPRAGDVRNLFMELAREQHDLSEIQSFLRLEEEELLEMVTWGIEEGLLFIEGED
ncbi:MAG: hypothetical protein ACXAB4_11730 [Candidatus Hodarchaeales archaeon]|jgi:hypothetical protein